MTVVELATLVDEMRAAQREFFKKRDWRLVKHAKELERKVDDAVEEILQKQPKLF